MERKTNIHPNLDLLAPGIVESLIDQRRIPVIKPIFIKKYNNSYEITQACFVAVVPPEGYQPTGEDKDRIVPQEGFADIYYSSTGELRGRADLILLSPTQAYQLQQRITALPK